MSDGKKYVARELTTMEALRLLDDKNPVPAGWRLRTAEEILRPYQDPETWAVMMEDITDPVLKEDLMRWVNSLRQEATAKSLKGEQS